MIDAPTMTCYEGDHLILMGLACVTLVVYTIGWPCFLCVAFRIADRKHLLNTPKFGGFLGFLYKRFEHQCYWWHSIVLLHKLAIIMAKNFLFDNFYQCPVALITTFALMSAQAFTTPYASTMLDR